jgi:hypothetical protein
LERRSELEQVKGRAHALLESGLKALPDSQPLDETTLAAMLSLAQADVETGRSAAAIQVLEQPQRGPLALVRQDHPLAARSGFLEETYRTALRACIAALVVDHSQAGSQKVQQLITEMHSRLGSTPAGQKQIVAIHVGLARDLEGQLRSANPEGRQALSSAMEAVLAQLSTTAADTAVLNWVAETWISLAEGSQSGGELTPAANKYLAQAASTFARMLDDPQLAPELQTQLRVRMADVHRRAQDHEAALQILRDILRVQNNALNVQVAAAETLQQAGRYEQAIAGSDPQPQQQNLIWGWGRIADVTSRHSKFLDVFHQARYSLADSRYHLAQTHEGSERRRLLDLAAQDISLTWRLYRPNDQRWIEQYDALLKQIQRSKGEQPVGLRAFERS